MQQVLCVLGESVWELKIKDSDCELHLKIKYSDQWLYLQINHDISKTMMRVGLGTENQGFWLWAFDQALMVGKHLKNVFVWAWGDWSVLVSLVISRGKECWSYFQINNYSFKSMIIFANQWWDAKNLDVKRDKNVAPPSGLLDKYII